MKYKVGDKVLVKSLEWYNANKDKDGDIKCRDTLYFTDLMSEFCGKIVTIDKILEDDVYIIQEDDQIFEWINDMFEGLAEEGIYDEEFKNAINAAYNACLDDKDDIDPFHELCQSKLSAVIIDSDVFKDEVELILNGYEVMTRGNKTYAIKKKPKYPTTYEECCKVLGSDPSRIMVISNHKDMIHEENKHCSEMYNIYQLLICRDAYWKIAGEQMGLGKSWEPDYVSLVNNEYFTIHTFNNEIIKSGTSHRNAILAFPTEEMRDVFFETFKGLIEKCKELL